MIPNIDHILYLYLYHYFPDIVAMEDIITVFVFGTMEAMVFLPTSALYWYLIETLPPMSSSYLVGQPISGVEGLKYVFIHTCQ